MKELRDMCKVLLSLLKPIFNFIGHLLKPYIKYIIFVFAFIVIIFLLVIIIGYFIDKNKNYDIKKIGNKVVSRTIMSSTNISGSEHFCSYWLWQRQKRKVIIAILCQVSTTHEYFQGHKWKKIGREKNWLKNECWINDNTLDSNELYKVRSGYYKYKDGCLH